MNKFSSPSSTGQVSVPLLPLSRLQRLVFLVNSRPLLLIATSGDKAYALPLRHSFFRRYRVNLPSSFFLLLSRAVVYLTCPPVSDSGTVFS